jgi:hypothetical protein
MPAQILYKSSFTLGKITMGLVFAEFVQPTNLKYLFSNTPI